MNKKLVLNLWFICTLYSVHINTQTSSFCQSTQELLQKYPTPPNSFTKPEKKTFIKQAQSKIKYHKKEIKFHQAKLTDLLTEALDSSLAAQFHREQIQFHKELYEGIKKDIFTIFKTKRYVL